jgi:hypothetical protein
MLPDEIFGPTGMGIVRADVPNFLDDAWVLRYIAVELVEFDAIWARAERGGR